MGASIYVRFWCWQALLVFDVSNRASFECLDEWITESRDFGAKRMAIVVAGNKVLPANGCLHRRCRRFLTRVSAPADGQETGGVRKRSVGMGRRPPA